MSKEKKNKNRRIEVAFFFDKHLPNFLHDLEKKFCIHIICGEDCSYFWGQLYPTYVHFPDPEPPTDYEVLFQQSPSFTSSFTRRNLRVGAIQTTGESTTILLPWVRLGSLEETRVTDPTSPSASFNFLSFSFLLPLSLSLSFVSSSVCLSPPRLLLIAVLKREREKRHAACI